jgi:hypothetical protein
VVLFEHFQHTDVRGTARTTTGKHQPDSWTAGLARERGFLRGRSRTQDEG